MYVTSLITFVLPISMPRFKSIFFYQNSPKIKLVLQKKENFQALGTPPPDPQTQPHIANFWQRAW